VASSPFPHFQLIDEYEAPLLNLQFDDIKAVFSRKKATGAFTTPQIPLKAPKKLFMSYLRTGKIFEPPELSEAAPPL
jgi:hypothetical protein